MKKLMIMICVLVSWSPLTQADSLTLNCRAPEQASYHGDANALVERSSDTVTVETELWVSQWQIVRQKDESFRAEHTGMQWKSVPRHQSRQDLMIDVANSTFRIAGPSQGFVLGKRYPCEITTERLEVASL
jgi:Tfp pilus assembly protein PilX